MDAEKLKAMTEQCEKTNREFFPELYPETRYQISNDSKSVCASEFFSEIIGLGMTFARDRSNLLSDRIAAMEVARKAANDQLNLRPVA